MMGACMGGMGGMLALTGVLGVAVIGGIVSIARHAGHGPQLTTAGGPAPWAGDAALTTLRDRFARGEIDRAEYEERRRALTDDGARWP